MKAGLCRLSFCMYDNDFEDMPRNFSCESCPLYDIFDEKEMAEYEAWLKNQDQKQNPEFCGYDIFDEKEYEAWLKNQDQKQNPEFCGFVIRHGENDIEGWQVQLPESVQEQLWTLLKEYQNCGCSVRDCSNMRINEVF